MRPSRIFIGGAGVDHVLLADDVQSTSNVTSPVITQKHVILASSTESASSVTTPAVTQLHGLLSTSVESTSELSSPSLQQVHGLLVTNVQSLSELTSPLLVENVADHVLLAEDISSLSNVSTPTLQQVQNLLAVSPESVSVVSAPSITQLHALLGTSVQSTSEVSSPLASSGIGGTFNIAGYFPTGQVDVTIALYHPITGASITLSDNTCSEIGTTGIYIWDVSNLSTQPTTYQEYAWVMNDGVSSLAGVKNYNPINIDEVNYTEEFIVHSEWYN